jgi:type I restriction enzyme, S subunit
MGEWGKAKLTDIAEYINGFAFKPSDFSESGVPIVRIEQLKNPKGYYDFYEGKIPEKNCIYNGDLIFSWSASLFLKIWQNDIAYLNQHLFKVVPKEGIEKFFLKYLLESAIDELIKKAHGSTMQHITRKELQKFEVFLPLDFDEQIAIANMLSTIDQTIEKTEQLIAKNERIKTGLMQDFLTRGIDENGRIRIEGVHEFKDSLFGRIPKEWNVKKISEITDYIGSGVTPRGGSTVYQTSGILLIRSQNVLSGDFALNDVAYISDEINNSMLRSEIFQGDVLLNITGASIGRSVVVPLGFAQANVNQHVCSIRLTNKTIEKANFLSSFLNSYWGQAQISRYNAGSNREGLNYSEIKGIELPFPNDENEFKRISNVLDSLENSLKSLKKEYAKKIKIKTALMQDLLRGKVRVDSLIEIKK